MTYLSQEQEDQEYELNARYDYISEAYGHEAMLLNQMAEDDALYEMQRYYEDYADRAEACCGVPDLLLSWPDDEGDPW